MKKHESQPLFTAISGLKYPTASRKYLMDLVHDIVVQDGSKFVVVAGHVLDGKFLEAEYKARLYDELATMRTNFKEDYATEKKDVGDVLRALRARKSPTLKERTSELKAELTALKAEQVAELKKYPEEFHKHFVNDVVKGLNAFLPVIQDVNYHIVIAENVFDKWIGVEVLETLQRIRSDIRLIGQDLDGSYDTEVKIPIRMKGMSDVRVIVPRRQPWFYDIITSFMQRLINSFVPRTFSEAPDLILVGCTGTAAHLPFYKGVPSISIPALHKINEVTSTESMVGCVTVFVKNGDGARFIPKQYDFRPIVLREKELVAPPGISRIENIILDTLRLSDGTYGTIEFRIHQKYGMKYPRAEIKAAIEKLMERGLVKHNRKANRYMIPESAVISSVNVSLKDMLKDVKVIKHVVFSCVHVGALKTLYHSFIRDIVNLGENADALIENGDFIQGISHNYEYNGELLPGANGFDKQRILAAYLKAKVILEIFKRRLRDQPNTLLGKPVELLDRCLIAYVVNAGNHPSWVYYNKHSLVLQDYLMLLEKLLFEGIIEILGKSGVRIDAAALDAVQKSIKDKVKKVGETKLVEVNGILIGVKHPSKARTKSKSQRIQEVTDSLNQMHMSLRRRLTVKSKKQHERFAVAYIANFHEAASVWVVRFGQAVLGVMTGAYLKDSSFENDHDKVVDHGPCVVTLGIVNDAVVWSETDFVDSIAPEDEKIVFADDIRTDVVLELSAFLNDIAKNIPWR